MKTTKLSTAILIGSAVIGSTNCEAQVEKDSLELSNNPNKENQLEKKFPIIKKDSIELEKRLKELSETEYKGKLAMGAMCYAVSLSINKDSMDLSCNICNKKTRYRERDIYYVKYITDITNKIKALNYDVVLDYSEYCNHCNKERLKEPSLIFKIRFSKDADYHVTKSNIKYDYLILFEFLKGNDKYDKGMEGEFPLHLEIDVLKKMTGLGKDIIVHKHYGFGNWNKEEFIKKLKEFGYSDEEIEKRIKEEDEKE